METIRAPLGPSLQVGTWLADGVGRTMVPPDLEEERGRRGRGEYRGGPGGGDHGGWGYTGGWGSGGADAHGPYQQQQQYQQPQQLQQPQRPQQPQQPQQPGGWGPAQGGEQYPAGQPPQAAAPDPDQDPLGMDDFWGMMNWV